MDMKNYIEKAEKKAGTQKKLADMLGISASYIRMVKAGQKGFSIDMCIVLADYIEEDRLEVIAASNLVTEKDERKRKILESCFKKVESVAAATCLIGVTTIMTPSPANASQITDSHLQNLYYVKYNRRKKGRRFSDQLNDYFGKLATFFQRGHSLN